MSEEEYVELIHITEPPFGAEVLARMFQIPVHVIENALSCDCPTIDEMRREQEKVIGLLLEGAADVARGEGN